MGNSTEKLYDRLDRRISREIQRFYRLNTVQNREIQLIARILQKPDMKFEQVEMHDAISATIHIRSVAVASKIQFRSSTAEGE